VQKSPLSTKIDIYYENVEDMRTSYYDRRYYLRRALSSRFEVLKTVSDIIENTVSFTTSYQSLVKQESEIIAKMEKANIRFNSVFKKYEESNMGKAAETRKFAEDYLKVRIMQNFTLWIKAL